MSDLRAGFGRVDITPRLGCRFLGYGNRRGGATDVHDPLLARALVLEGESGRYALISCDLLFVRRCTTTAVREAVERRLGIPADHVLIAAIHTHSGPDDMEAANWQRPLGETVTDAVAQAVANLQPARVGSGFGYLYGHSINRRWIDKPVDPAVGVIRVDDMQGHPIGLVCSFACHGVVMGPDNLSLSADWPGQACRDLQAAGFGECMYFQSGSGDVNPLVAGVRARLESGHTVVGIGGLGGWYGDRGDPETYNVGDRTGGTFEEVAELAAAFAAEAARVARTIRPQADSRVWTKSLCVDPMRSPGEPITPLPAWANRKPISDGAPRDHSEVMLFGIGGILLVGQPGEVFSETSVRLRTELRRRGYHTPMLVGYANGVLSYLPEPDAFDEGGYEPVSPTVLGVSHYYQQRVREAVSAAI